MSDSMPFSSIPLFDRLRAAPDTTTHEGHESEWQRLRRSVKHELENLFSSRSGLAMDAYLTGMLTVLDYGLPDTTALSMDSVLDRQHLEKAIARAIATFEPRLRTVTVSVRASAIRGADACISVNGTLRLAHRQHRVQFELAASGNPEASKVIDVTDVPSSVVRETDHV
ncbi:type VI secretion system baseplate subunit TssE [Robbsia sp. KACC 23696]|uniref:type VI secretion system baseplate subunit TssE n=1 Tax=Robbsia sp. KACC 23696 TaxID=3149231 RepID=UPI00325A86FD